MKTLVTCHANADCDAFAAMLAARRLYPSCHLFFPGTQEAGLGRAYTLIDKEKYNFIDGPIPDLQSYDRLVVVDTRQSGRIRHVSPLLEKPGLVIEIWDHHPQAPDDIEAAHVHFARYGSATTLLCEALREKGCQLTPEEATFLGLGIYGDTGSFTYSSTTPADFQAASWLLEQGMDVNKINDMACHELTSLHVHALDNLLQSARTYMVGNVPVVLAEASMEHYLGDFAYLAQKLMEMEKFQVLFAIGLMGDRIQVVARSRNETVDVGKVCATLGGGGHAYAASASVRGKMITEVREYILQALYDQVNPDRFARDYMSSPAIGVEMDTTIHRADELMLHFGLKAVPVFKPGTKICAGLLDAQTAARAAAHGLGSEPVKEYMQRRIFTLPPGASIRELTEIIVGSRQRLVPIVENDQVKGVVTRTDLINVFANESGALKKLRDKKSSSGNILKQINERLPAETRGILTLAGELGKKLGLTVYAVGGFVRDLLLDHPNQDIDLVAEGNGIALARALAEELGGRVREHEKFLTSVVVYHNEAGEERRIDVATARLEYYEYPAALPTVELSSIKMDLFRRDFSINALAVRLDGEHFGELVDFFGGRRDIKDKLIRVLHTLSFVEDPTRCIRAVRFEQRYDFRIGPGTEKLIQNILPMHLLEKLSAHRLFNEFKHICEEETGAEAIMRLDELGILKALGQMLVLNPAKKNLLLRIKNILAWYKMLYYEETQTPWICYFYALVHHLNYAEASEGYRCLGLPEGRKSEIMRQREKMRSLRPKLLQWQKKYEIGHAKISHFYELLRDSSLESLLYTMAVLEDSDLEKNISRYITTWRREKADINGNDLKRLGLKPGPEYGRLLNLALLAKLDDKAPTAKKQLALVLAEIKAQNSENIV